MSRTKPRGGAFRGVPQQQQQQKANGSTAAISKRIGTAHDHGAPMFRNPSPANSRIEANTIAMNGNNASFPERKDQDHGRAASSGRDRNGRRRGRDNARYASTTRDSRGSDKAIPQSRGGRKRKLEVENSSGRPTQRIRIAMDATFMDEAWLRRELRFPTAKDYPHAPHTLFNNLLVSALHNVGNNALKLKQSVVSEGRGFRCEVSGVLFDGRPHSAVGMGYNKARSPIMLK